MSVCACACALLCLNLIDTNTLQDSVCVWCMSVYLNLLTQRSPEFNYLEFLGLFPEPPHLRTVYMLNKHSATKREPQP